ncbi:MAG: sugar transferase [Kiritimatiellae bacterium]|nr:sugar transferase [Kiritimatiellia bacterium]
MNIRRLKEEAGLRAGDTLQSIEKARREGFAAAVPADHLAFMRDISLIRTIEGGELRGCYLFAERAPDCGRTPLAERLLAFALIIFFVPLLLGVSVAVLSVDGPPVFFRQLRFGFKNRGFKIFKFRTMVIQSERLHRRMQRRWEKQGRLFKLDDDPRVTRLGGFLRATFLDELPQLFNVLKGEMRLIGPRPLPASDAHHYTHVHHQLRLRGMPGMTGLWQVSGRSALTFDQMCLLDYYYCCNRSWRLDLRIILKTLRLLLKRKG